MMPKSIAAINAVDHGNDKPLPFKVPLPVFTDIGIAGGVGLHKQQWSPRGKGCQLTRYAERAILLCRGNHNQHIAQREDLLQPVAVTRLACGLIVDGLACRRLSSLRVGIGAVDQHDLGHGSGVSRHHDGTNLVGRKPADIGACRGHYHGPNGRRPRHITRLRNIPTSQCIDQRAFTSACSPKEANHQRAPQFFKRSCQPRLHFFPQLKGCVCGWPRGERVNPVVKAPHKSSEGVGISSCSQSLEVSLGVAGERLGHSAS
jgi:hypothetical protein